MTSDASSTAVQYFELITHNAAKLRIFLENAVDGGAAAAHGGVDGAFVVEGLLEAGEGGVSGEDGAFEVVEDPVLPFFDREGVQEVAQAAARRVGGEGGEVQGVRTSPRPLPYMGRL